MKSTMRRSELVRKLKKAGYKIEEGGKHGMAIHPDKPGKIPVPHGSKIDYWTGQGILKDAGLE